MPDRRLLGAAVVAVAMLAAPVGALAGKPVRTTTCTVSTGVQTTSVKSKGSVTLTLTGTSGADTIDCSAITKGGVVINGGGGNDLIIGTPFADSITDGAIGPGSFASIEGRAGNDIIRAGWGDFTSSSSASVAGEGGDDQIVANGGYLNASGGDGNDLLDLSNAYAANAGGDAGNDTVTGPSVSIDAFCSCVNVLDGGTGNDTVIGGAGRDDLSGGPGTDDMHAGPGNDSITDYGSGSEVFDCGDGNDLADDYDGNGVATDGTVGYLNAPEDDTHPSCETLRVAVSAG
jgi:Ca2+-binding RTX toxin-like protein